MRRSLAITLLGTLLATGHAGAQLLDETLVRKGYLRLQAYPHFTSWDSRYGRAADGTEQLEELGEDLTDPTGHVLFPGLTALSQLLEGVTGSTGYTPGLGAVDGRVTKDITRVDFGGHVGVLDWLTIGVVVPWVQTRTAIDFTFLPDTVGGAELGLSPTLTDGASVDAYLASLLGAATAAETNATSACSGGPGPACDAAQMLADRAAGLLASIEGAYAAAPFFPMAGTAMAMSLDQVSSTLDTDLMGAGLPSAGAMPFASQTVTAADLSLIPFAAGSGYQGFPLASRRGLWAIGDIEVSALVRLLERIPVDSLGEVTGLSYRLTAGFVARLPTGTPESPDIFLDLGTGDAQTDMEGRVSAAFTLGRLGLAAGGRYGVQGSTTLTKRVAPLELVLPPLATRQSVDWEPGGYLGVDLVPSVRLTEELVLTGHYRYFQKDRDTYSLVDPSLPLDATQLGVESGVKQHQFGGGLRFATVRKWASGMAPRPMELHVRYIRTVSGGGGHTPVSTRVEAGLRIFRRIWGASPNR